MCLTDIADVDTDWGNSGFEQSKQLSRCYSIARYWPDQVMEERKYFNETKKSYIAEFASSEGELVMPKTFIVMLKRAVRKIGKIGECGSHYRPYPQRHA